MEKLNGRLCYCKGHVRKNSLEDFININNSGKIAMKLDQDDKIGVKICKDEEDILLSTKFGKCIRFKSKKLRLFKGRSSKGIKGIQLKDNDKVISLSILNNTQINLKNNEKNSKSKFQQISIYFQLQKMVMEKEHPTRYRVKIEVEKKLLE